MKITDEAVTKAAWVIAEGNSRAWLTYSDDTRAAIARSWEPTVRAALATALPQLEGFRGVYEAAASLQTAEDIATVIEEYADDLELPTTTEWLELRGWFKGLLHEVAARAREIGGAS